MRVTQHAAGNLVEDTWRAAYPESFPMACDNGGIRANSGADTAVPQQVCGFCRLESFCCRGMWRSGRAGQQDSPAGLDSRAGEEVSGIADRVRPVVREITTQRPVSAGTSGKLHTRTEYVVVATPVNANTGTRSFCSTSDTVIHFKAGPPLTAQVSVSECRAWAPLQ